MAKQRDFEAFRPGKKYGFILDDLRRFTNKSARIREMYLLGMAVERGEYVKAADIPQPSVDHLEAIRKEWEKMQGSFVRPAPPVLEEPPTVAYEHVAPAAQPISGEEEDDIVANMLAGFD